VFYALKTYLITYTVASNFVLKYVESASDRDLSSCECPPRCNNVDYKATISSSRLSDKMIDYHLSRSDYDSVITRRYLNSAEIRSRVASPLLSDIMTHLEKLSTAYQRLKAMLAVDLIEQTTSVPGQIYASVNTIVQQTHDSLAEFKSQLVDKFFEYYEQNTDFFVTQFTTYAKTILSYQVYFENRDAINERTFNMSRVQKMLQSRSELCENFRRYFREHQYHFIEVSPHSKNFSAHLVVDRTCMTGFVEHCNGADLIQLTPNSTNYTEDLLEIYKHATGVSKTALRCIPIYRTLLNEAQTWIESAVSINSSLPLRPGERRDALVDIENELNWLKTISHSFAENPTVRSIIIIILKYRKQRIEQVSFCVHFLSWTVYKKPSCR